LIVGVIPLLPNGLQVSKGIRQQLGFPLPVNISFYWEIITDNLSKAGWSWGCVSALDCEGRTIWIVDAHRDDGKRFVVHADEKLTAFLELESAVRAR
jgi:hypothetical protein